MKKGKQLYDEPMTTIAIRVPREVAETLRGYQARIRRSLIRMAIRIRQEGTP